MKSSKNAPQMTDFHAESSAESTAVPPIMYLTTSLTIMKAHTEKPRLIYSSPSKQDAKSTPHIITIPSGFTNNGILDTIPARILLLNFSLPLLLGCSLSYPIDLSIFKLKRLKIQFLNKFAQEPWSSRRTCCPRVK